jgi:molybdate transport system substrate-binding protein
MIGSSSVAATLKKGIAAAWCLTVVTAFAAVASAGEVKLFAAGALTPAMRELIPQFETSSGHKVTIVYGNINALAERIEKSEAADVVITSPARIEALIKNGRVAPGSQIMIASVGAGVAIRNGTPKPDIGSVEAFKRTLLAAKSVSYGDPGVGNPTGIHMAKVNERLGIAGDMASKTKLIRGVPAFKTLFDDLRSGATELGIEQISLIVGETNIELAGPLPAEVQSSTQYAAGIVSTSAEPGSASALLQFLSAAAAKGTFKTKGFDVP